MKIFTIKSAHFVTIDTGTETLALDCTNIWFLSLQLLFLLSESSMFEKPQFFSSSNISHMKITTFLSELILIKLISCLNPSVVYYERANKIPYSSKERQHVLVLKSYGALLKKKKLDILKIIRVRKLRNSVCFYAYIESLNKVLIRKNT